MSSPDLQMEHQGSWEVPATHLKKVGLPAQVSLGAMTSTLGGMR